MSKRSPRVRHLADGLLRIAADPESWGWVKPWLPRSALAPVAMSPSDLPAPSRVGRITVSAEASGPDESGSPPSSAPLLRLGSVQAWWRPGGASALELRGGHSTFGHIDLVGQRARIAIPRGSADPGMDVHFMLTVSAALLLARRGRALVHAAAVAPPGKPVLLLVGDARAGKSTTTASLVRQGWDYLSDDQVVLDWDDPDATAGSAPRAEGWLRTFHLDRGWSSGQVTGERADLDPDALAGARRLHGTIGGLVFPTVLPDQPSELHRLAPAEALAALLRQTPWLFADPAVAPSYLERLRRAARVPAYSLRLGLDTYRAPERLVELLKPVLPP